MTHPSSMRDLYRRLDQVGFPKAYVRTRILPDWWEDGLAQEPGNRRLAEMAIARTLSIPLATLVAPDEPIRLDGDKQVRFLRRQGVEEPKLLPAIAIARRVAELAVSAAVDLPSFRLEGVDPAELRERLLAHSQYVTLSSLATAAWDFGVPVVHVSSLPKGAKRVDGMAFLVADRPCIALASSRKPPALLLWHLAHELGHVALGHLHGGATLDVSIDFDSNDTAERAANEFAKPLVYGETAGFRAGRHLKAERLAAEARQLGPQLRVQPASIVTSYGFHMKAWGTMQNALEALGAADGGPDILRQVLKARVDLDRLGETDRHFFASSCAIPLVKAA